MRSTLKTRLTILIAFATVLALTACGGQVSVLPTVDPTLVSAATRAAELEAETDEQSLQETPAETTAQPVPETENPTIEPGSSQETPTSPPSPTPAPSPTPTAVPVGNWLLAATSESGISVDSIWAFSEDGTEVRQLISGQQIIVPYDWDLDNAVSPDGSRIAVITSSDALALTGLELRIINIPSGSTRLITPLTSAETEPSGDPGAIDDPNLGIAQTLSEVSPLAWSPDGRYLAFMGAIVGDSSDVYLYDTQQESIRQLTGEPEQAIRPVFSPDGQSVVYVLSTGLGTGAGFGIEGVARVPIEEGGASQIYSAQTGDEVLIGWISERTAIVHSWDAVCGNVSLRQVNIDTGEVTRLWPNYFKDVAFDPVSETMMVTVDNLTESCSGDLSTGVYRIGPESTLAEAVVDASAVSIRWEPDAGRFFYRYPGQQHGTVTPDGEVAIFTGPEYTRLDVSPGGEYIAYAATENTAMPGLYVMQLGEDDEPADDTDYVAEIPVDYPRWSPDGERLFVFGTDGSVYIISEPFEELVPVASGFVPGNWEPLWNK